MGLREDRRWLTALISLMAVGHLPLILGWRQPIGGDKTGFFYPLMQHYSDCLAAGTLPFWNGRWGFGFPGLAESQVGALYPPHLLLYSLLPAFDAFRWDLIVHRLLTVGLAYVSGRWFGLRPLGAGVFTLVVSLGGFAVCHYDHQWAYCGLPWVAPILASGHRWLRSGDGRSLLGLSFFLAMLLLVGHFQIAFMTLVGLVALTVVVTLEQRCWLRSISVGVAAGLGFLIAAAQLAPTYLLQAAIRQEHPGFSDPDRLRTHALPPWMLGGSLLPLLYYREPLWRDVVWTPAVTAPEECLHYFGLLPMALALGLRGRRGAWAGISLVAISLLLACAPFLPGFAWLVRLPGFSVFRASARWTLLTQVGVAWLAGQAADRCRSSRTLADHWRRLLWVSGIHFALTAGWWVSASVVGEPIVRIWTSTVARLSPWGAENTIPQMLRTWSSPRSPDPYTLRRWLELGRSAQPLTIKQTLLSLLTHEVLPTLMVVLVTTVVIARVRRARRVPPLLIVGLVLADLITFWVCIPDQWLPVRQLDPPQPSVHAILDLPAETRVASNFANLPQIWGKGSIPAYRTLDVPLPATVDRLIRHVIDQGDLRPLETSLGRLLGLEAVVVQTQQSPPKLPTGWSAQRDDQIETWRSGGFGPARLQREPITTILARPTSPTVVGMVVPRAEVQQIASRQSWQPSPMGSAMAGSIVGQRSLLPVREFQVQLTEPAGVILGELSLPGWQAEIEMASGRQSVPISVIDQYWQYVPMDVSGAGTLRLNYSPPGFVAGCRASALGLMLGAIAWIYVQRQRRRPASQSALPA